MIGRFEPPGRKRVHAIHVLTPSPQKHADRRTNCWYASTSFIRSSSHSQEMDWARDDTGVSDKDLDAVFKYEQKFTTVVRILEDDAKPLIWTLETEEEWKDWFEVEYPHIDDGASSGLILILVRRAGEPSLGGLKKVKTDEWLDRIERSLPGRTKPERAMTFDEKSAGSDPTAPASFKTNGQPKPNKLHRTPFSKPTFRLITEKFYTHGSIARAISRADIPVFASTEVRMGGYRAFVTNCRTTNAWNMDLALTCTYFPHCGLTFSIFFGCSLAIEEDILKRLSFSTREAAHPLLMPGVLAELERSRHIHLVDHTLDELETRIFELDFKTSDMDGPGDDSETERKNFDKRNSWLDTVYLKNQLTSWNTQLAKIAANTDVLEKHLFTKTVAEDSKEIPGRRNSHRSQDGDSANRTDTAKRSRSDVDAASIQRFRERVRVEGRKFLDVENLNPVQAEEQKRRRQRSRERVDRRRVEISPDSLARSSMNPRRKSTSSVVPPKVGIIQDSSRPASRQRGEVQAGDSVSDARPSLKRDPEAFRDSMRRVGAKIKDRVQTVVDEYDDKIRDCTVRVDGMAMATQWADGETNVQIALEMRRDSRHMRSIAVVTMVFLPGTFFASIFSMTFFNWSPDGSSEGPNNTSDEVVSPWLWIYVLFTAIATAATVASWYYFVVYRNSRGWKLKRAKKEGLMGEEAIPLV
ncbi:hypothetical protein V8F20_005072 [Naviculisporaceae sp. PSN 640]